MAWLHVSYHKQLGRSIPSRGQGEQHRMSIGRTVHEHGQTCSQQLADYAGLFTVHVITSVAETIIPCLVDPGS